MLFSTRYRGLTEADDGTLKDEICCDVNDAAKRKLSKIMHEYDGWVTYRSKSDDTFMHEKALHHAVTIVNGQKDFPDITLGTGIDGKFDRHLAGLYTPRLFDIIETQYGVLSDDKKIEFQSEINGAFSENGVPWIMHDGEMMRLDSKVFEEGLKLKVTDELKNLKDVQPEFQSAYDEFKSAVDCLTKGENESAVLNAAKSYESVMKVMCSVNGGTLDKLTKAIIEKKLINLPENEKYEGFRQEVMMSLPYIRNNFAAHGSGSSIAEMSESLANLAVNLAASLDTYLIEEYKKNLAK